MLLFTAIFVFYKLTILQGNYADEISGHHDTTFSCKQNRNSKQCLPFCWSWPNRIRKHWFCRLRYLLHNSKFTFTSWLLDSLHLPSQRNDTHRLMSRVDYGFNQWSVVSFVIKKLCVLIYGETVYIFIYTHILHANIFSPILIWK